MSYYQPVGGTSTTSLPGVGFNFTLTPEPWRQDAACLQVDPDKFFPERGGLDSGQDAKRICKGCDVREQCLAYALRNNEEFGIWGGLSPQQRAKLRRAGRGAA